MFQADPKSPVIAPDAIEVVIAVLLVSCAALPIAFAYATVAAENSVAVDVSFNSPAS